MVPKLCFLRYYLYVRYSVRDISNDPWSALILLTGFVSSDTSPYVTCVTTAPAQPSWASNKQRALKRGGKEYNITAQADETGICPIESSVYETVKVEYSGTVRGAIPETVKQPSKCLEYPDLQVIFFVTGVGRKETSRRQKKTHPEWNHESRIVSFNLAFRRSLLCQVEIKPVCGLWCRPLKIILY